jgi:hypothetical protein
MAKDLFYFYLELPVHELIYLDDCLGQHDGEVRFRIEDSFPTAPT